MRKSQLIKHLSTLEEEDLRQEILTLYDRSSEVKKYYSMELGSHQDREKLFAKAKADIDSKYKTKSYRRPRRPRIAKIKKLLSEVEKVSIYQDEMADLHLYNCECALSFMENYRFISTPLFNTIFYSFNKAVDMIVASMENETYYDRCKSLCDRADDQSGVLGDEMRNKLLELKPA